MSSSVRRRTIGAAALALALAAIAGPARATDGVWTAGPSCTDPLTQHCPSERSTPAVGAIGTNIYLFGGVKDDFRTGIDVFYNDLYKFDTVTSSWTKLHPKGLPPFPRAFAAGLAANGKLYVFGGATYQANFVGFIAHDDLWEYNPTDWPHGKWRRLGQPLEGPGGRSRPNMWFVGGKLYVFGGINSLFQTHNDLWAFDLATEEWAELIPNDPDPENENLPQTRHEGQTGQTDIGGKLFVYSGEHVDLLSESVFSIPDDTWALDVTTQPPTWTDVTPSGRYPQPARNYGATGIIGGKMYIHGGDTPGGSQDCGAPFPQNPSDEIWRFDPSTGSWGTQPLDVPGSVPLKRHVAAVVGGTMYIFGGFDFDCDELTAPGQIWNTTVYTFTPAA